MNELYPIIRRKRRPLIEPEAAPVVVIAPMAPVVEPPPLPPMEIPKPKNSRDDVAKN